MDVLEIEAVALAGAIVVGVGGFDLDHLGAHLAELADAGRTRSGAGQVDDFDVRQRAPGLQPQAWWSTTLPMIAALLDGGVRLGDAVQRQASADERPQARLR